MRCGWGWLGRQLLVVCPLVFCVFAQDVASAQVDHVSATTTAYPQAVLADHPSSYYRLDENAGPIASDSSGNGHDGTYQSGVQFGTAGALPSESDPAISSTLTGVAVTESGADLPAGDTPRTLEVWVNNACCALPFDLLRYGDVAGGHGVELALAGNADSIIVTAGATSVSAFPVGDFGHGWHLLDVTYAGGTAAIYEDGQIIGSGPLSAAGTVTPGQGLRIATNASGMGLDEAAVYPTALSATSIDAHWTAAESTPQIASCSAVPTLPYPAAVLADAPLMAFRLDESGQSAQGRIAIDYSSHCSNAAYHGHPTAVAGALTGDADPGIGASAQDVALAQTGSTLPAGGGARTLEAWVRNQCCSPGFFDLLRYGDVAGGHGFEVALAGNADSIVVTAGGTSVTAFPVGDFQHGWHLLDVTYDGTTVEIYQDGQIIGGGPLGAVTTSSPGQGFRAALNAAGAGLDEIAVYGSALSPQRISAHFRASTLTAGGPSATITTPANGSSFVKGQVVAANFSCSPGASGGILKPGTAGCSGTIANGAVIDTSSTGSHSVQVTATDTDGRSTTITSTYTVTAPVSPTLIRKTAQVSGGKAKLAVSCKQPVACLGKIEIEVAIAVPASKHRKNLVVVARGSYSVGPGKTATITVPLTRNGSRLLREHHGKLHTTLKLTPAGGQATRFTLTLKHRQGQR